MFSPQDPNAVLGEVGSKVLTAIAEATAEARTDWEDLRAWRPLWIPTMTQRGVANILHERIWAHAVERLDGLTESGICIKDSEPVREIVVCLPEGRTYRLRVKRHSDAKRISSYPTQADVEFWGGTEVFDGMEEIHLAAGYRWDAQLREIGAAVMSFREGKHNPRWMVEIDGAAGGAAGGPVDWRPVSPMPGLPDIDLLEAAELELSEEGGAP